MRSICLPVIVSFCLQHKIPYNFTMFPNYIGHFTQRDAQLELEVYDAVEDVRCYELAALFLCSVFVPKCGRAGQLVRPCRSLCAETKRRCGFFLDVFGLTLPEYLECELFPESEDSDVCVGHREVIEADLRAQKPVCLTGFQCDQKRCIPSDWKCDGHVDCEDQTDELDCHECAKGEIHCGSRTCMDQTHMCDGVRDCPWGQDERNCIRLSEKMGDESKGKLEVFQPILQSWKPACMTTWDPQISPKAICSMLGYRKVNASNLAIKGSAPGTKLTIKYTSHPLKRYTVPKRHPNLLKELRDCNTENYAPIELACSNFVEGARYALAPPISNQPCVLVEGARYALAPPISNQPCVLVEGARYALAPPISNQPCVLVEGARYALAPPISNQPCVLVEGARYALAPPISNQPCVLVEGARYAHAPPISNQPCVLVEGARYALAPPISNQPCVLVEGARYALHPYI
ncbi:hypothetical protein J6590_015775 [Homalodisca vitripennis]|nr:hypothetical protein J6590_015775 [Homalodisca vitripennis]